MWQMWKLLYQSKGCLNRLDTEILHVYKWIENKQNILCVFMYLCVCPACQIYQHIINLVTHCINLAQKYEIKSPNPIWSKLCEKENLLSQILKNKKILTAVTSTQIFLTKIYWNHTYEVPWNNTYEVPWNHTYNTIKSYPMCILKSFPLCHKILPMAWIHSSSKKTDQLFFHKGNVKLEKQVIFTMYAH